MAFDVNDDTFRDIMLPHNYSDGVDVIEFKRLTVLVGSLALLAFGESLNEFHEVCLIG